MYTYRTCDFTQNNVQRRIMVKFYPAFKTMVVMLLGLAAAIKLLFQAMSFNVVDRLELGGWMWNLMGELMMENTLSISKSGGHHPLWIRWVEENIVWWETTGSSPFL